jgi:nucleotide-binding universal stress UspA family protein
MVGTFFPAAWLAVFHAYDVPMKLMAPDLEAHRDQFRSAAAESARAFLAETKLAERQETSPQVILEEGPPEVALESFVLSQNLDLVAVGTQGRSALVNALIGSVAQKLLTHLTCDVLIIR